jgi:ribonuclease D
LILDRLRTVVAEKAAAVAACGAGFTPEAYSLALATARLAAQEPPKAPQATTYSEADVGHPELFEALKAWRAEKAAEEGVAHFRVLHQKTLIQIAVHLPDSIGALKAVKGIGDKLAERYGEQLVALVAAYRQKHGIEAVILPDPSPAKARPRPKKATAAKVDTKQLSLELFEKGLNISQIAAQRGLATATIEGHLAHWVAQGRLTIDRVVTEDARQAIEKGVVDWDGVSYKVLKESLDKAVSYGEIKLVLAHLKWRASRVP